MKEEAGLVRPSIDIIFISSLGLWRWSAGHIALSTPECTKFTCITQDGFYIILILLYSIIFKIFKAGNFLAILLVLNDIIFMPLYYIECLLLIDFFKISSNWPLKNFVSYILLPFSKVFLTAKIIVILHSERVQLKSLSICSIPILACVLDTFLRRVLKPWPHRMTFKENNWR